MANGEKIKNKSKENQNKVQSDPRFEKLLKNKNFGKSKFDKRGRKIDDGIEQGYSENIDMTQKDSDEDSSEESCDDEIENVDLEEALGLDKRETSETISTSRLAINYLDWDNMDATDIYMLVSSFCKTNEIKSVKVFMSEFGRSRLNGEKQDIPTIKEEDPKVAMKKYFLERQMYYFGVVEFIDSETAGKVYELGDGLEIEHSSCKVDFSFVPDDVKFDSEPASECFAPPTNYEAQEFVSKAIQQTNCEFDWDGVDNKRSAIMFKKKFTEKDLDDFDKFEKYIATPSGSDNENAETYKELFANEKVSESSDSNNSESSEDQESDVSEDDLKESSVKIRQETTKSACDYTLNDPLLTTKPQKSKYKPKDTQKQKISNDNELDLLMYDPENEEDKHFDYLDEIKKSKKKKKAKEEAEEFTVDVNDKRFSALFKSPHFAVDPSTSQFKKTKNMNEVLRLQTTKRKKFQ